MVMTWPRRSADSHTSSLLAAARAGEESALEQLLLPHEPTLRAVCRGMLDKKEDIEDALQETYLRALRGLDSYRGEAQLRTWLVRIAVNVCSARLGKRREEPTFDEATSPLTTPSPEREVVRRALLDEALATLSPQRRVVLLLKAEGWTLEEIGSAQGWSAARVKVELFRARTALEKWADQRAQEEARV